MHYWVWMVIALLLLIMEIFSLTFYLLVVSMAFFITGLCGLILNTSNSVNMVLASILSIIGILVVNRLRRKHKRYSGKMTDEDDFDIGEVVEVSYFDQHGLGEVIYRGVQWQARLDEETMPNDLESLVGERAKILRKDANLLIVRMM